jgi:hypothetical protein
MRESFPPEMRSADSVCLLVTDLLEQVLCARQFGFMRFQFGDALSQRGQFGMQNR